MTSKPILIAVVLGLALLGSASAQQAGGPDLSVLDSIIQNSIQYHEVPGAVVLVGHNGEIIYRKAFGDRALEPRVEPMTLDTIFDLASLTKVVATPTAIMQLEEHGSLRLNDPVVKYIPEFGQNGKSDITV